MSEFKRFYKLVGYDPYWTDQFKNDIFIDHIENLVNNFDGIYWQEIKNVDVTFDYNQLELKAKTLGNYSTYPKYIKMVVANVPYYFFFYTKKLDSIDKNGYQQWMCYYQRDNYMTIFHNKLNLLIKNNPNVYCNRRYRSRWSANDSEYVVDWINDREFNTIFNNGMLIRTGSWWTNVDDLWISNVTGTIERPNDTKWTTPNNQGRFTYIICKSSALVTSNNNTLQSTSTNQSRIVIPVFNDDVLHGLNDFTITEQQTNCLNPFGDNFISYETCDVPYEFLWLCKEKGLCELKVGHNKVNNTVIDIEYFEIPLNTPLPIIIKAPTDYQGLQSKITYMEQNLNKVIPETEPSLLNNSCYYEKYDNGNGNYLQIDTSFLKYKWNKTNGQQTLIAVKGYLIFDEGISLAYSFGSSTNEKLPSFDNTNTIITNIGLKIGLVGSSSSNYYSNNVNTGLTSVQNRQSEFVQASLDATYNVASKAAQLTYDTTREIEKSGNSLLGILTGGGTALVKTAAKGIIFATDVAKIATDTAMSQDRAFKKMHNSINNIYSAAQNNLTNPFIKSCLTNNNKLFEHYIYELHPYDKDYIFSEKLNKGDVSNKLLPLQDIFNRQYMNILDIDPYVNYETLSKIIREQDTTIFNDEFWNHQFFLWLATPKHVYNTMVLINVLDWKANDYIDNIENNIISVIPGGIMDKINLKIVFNNSDIYKSTFIPYGEEDILQQLQNDYTAPNILWNEIEIIILSPTTFIVKAKDDSEHYYGSVTYFTHLYYYKVSYNNHTIYSYNYVGVRKNSSQYVITFDWDVNTMEAVSIVTSSNNNFILEICGDITELPSSFFEEAGINEITFNCPNLRIINDWCFANTHLSETITIPSSVTLIKEHAFYHASYKNIIFDETTIPIVIEPYTFISTFYDKIDNITINRPTIINDNQISFVFTSTNIQNPPQSYIDGTPVTGIYITNFMDNLPEIQGLKPSIDNIFYWRRLINGNQNK